jgi:hypothetical protein
MDHVIQKQLFFFSASDGKQAREWEGKLHSIIHSVINPSIERCFTELSTTNEHLVIDKLEIDLGILNNQSPVDLERVVKEQLISQLHKDSKLYFNGKVVCTTTNPSTRESTDQYRGVPGNFIPDIVQTLTVHQKNFYCFLHFLSKGILPWWADTERIDLENEWIDNLSAEEAEQIAGVLSRRSQLLDRIVFQFSEVFISRLIRQYLPNDADTMLESWRSLEKFYDVTTDRGYLHKQYWKHWLEKAFRLPTNDLALLDAFASWLRSAPEVKAALAATPEYKNTILFDGLRLDVIVDNLKEVQKSIPEASSTITIGEEGGPSPTSFPKKNKDLQPSINGKDTDDQETKLGVDETELFVSGAGLVLLHPFLTELFTDAELWSKAGWTSDASLHQAVQLLSFLAFGETTVPEYKSLLPKILVNMPLPEPLDTRIDLPEKCKHMAKDLLNAVVKHWKAIGNTSIEGLQEGFILREGKVVRKNHDWHLTIEKKAQDILLNRLPWGISFIHLPWLSTSSLHVKWTD